MYKRLVTYDFDSTLFHTPCEEEGRKIWKEKVGYNFPYNGWWGKSESIDPEIFHIPLNQWVYRKYLEDVSNSENYVILATGRLAKVKGMRKNLDAILNSNNISFDEVHLNWGGDTFNFKTKLFEELSAKLKVKEILMYDDRHEHLCKFYNWAEEQPVDIHIVDVVHKRERKFNNI